MYSRFRVRSCCAIRRVLLAALVMATFVVAGCDDDDDCPSSPEMSEHQATIDNVWPHANGNGWQYEQTNKLYTWEPQLYDTAADVPALPDQAVLYAALGTAVENAAADSIDGTYSLTFVDSVTTMSGVTAQHLVEDLQTTPPVRADLDRLAKLLPPPLRKLGLARQDLRPALIRQYGLPADFWSILTATSRDLALDAPMFLGGGAWEQIEAGIFGYGDLNQDHSWIYLLADLETGSTFQMQLVPMLADDVFLYGKIWSHGPETVSGQAYPEVVECFYAIDMGVQNVVDEFGNSEGYTRTYFYGVIDFVPGLGPVFAHERVNYVAGYLQDEGPTAIIDRLSRLTGTVYDPED